MAALCVALYAAPAALAGQPQPARGPSQARRPARTEPASDEELRGISRRGQLLAQYDRVAWDASDALMALRPATDGLGAYVAERVGDTWRVAFGRLSAGRDAFVVAYEATRRRGDPAFRAAAVSPVRAETGYVARAARAVDVARAAFGPVQRPYNAAVIPAGGPGDPPGAADGWWVYVYPAATQPGVWPLGGDERFLVNVDGRTVRERRRLHKAVLEFSAPPAQQVEEGVHAAVLDDVPEDTDVFFAMTRTPRVPELVVTDAFVYRLTPDGTVACLGRRAAVLGTGPK